MSDLVFLPFRRFSDAARSQFSDRLEINLREQLEFPAFDVYHEHAGLDARDLCYSIVSSAPLPPSSPDPAK